MSRDTRTLIGTAGLACVACCIGPIMAMLGAIGVASVAGVATFGVVGVVVGLLAVPVYLRFRRRVAGCRTHRAETVPVAAPVAKRLG
jgi:Na+/melibiose symporter-like transporter